MRWLNGAVAMAFLVQAMLSNDGFAYALAAFFGLRALFKVGCCTSEGCATPDRSIQPPSQELGTPPIAQTP
ncbi:MAG TPA: hypothetical protein PKA92_00795 [Flavobacteriales bacterium]|nr:hypothetical protein [Flavobacteriales bacterium]